MKLDETPHRSFWQKLNDPQSRDLPCRLSRYLRAGVHSLSTRLRWLADDPRVFEAWRRGWDTEHYIRLRRWRDQGFQPKTLYDIGAYVGGWSEMGHSIFAPDRSVLFEPQKALQEQAQARQPAGANWTVIPVALGNVNEVRPMYVTENGSASSMLQPVPNGVPPTWGTREIEKKEMQIAALDALVDSEKLPVPDLVKIDVQGYEGEVIAGGKETLSKAQRIVVEVSLHPIYKDQSLLPEIASTFSDWGFEIDDINETCREWAGRLWQADLWLKRRA